MKKLKFFLSLLMLFTFSLGTMWATLPVSPTWEETALASIADGSTIVIISNSTAATNIALPAAGAGTSNPPKKACTLTTTDGVTTITPPSGTTLQDLAWTLKKSGDNYNFFVEGSSTSQLYLTGLSSNTAIRVGTPTASNYPNFVMGEGGKLLEAMNGTNRGSRFVGPNDNSGTDWRSYNSETASNYKSAELTFYVLRAAGSDPAVSSNKSTIDFGIVLTGALGPYDTEFITDTFTLTGANLNSNVNLQATTIPAGAIFSVDPTSVTPSDKSINQQVVVWAQTGVAGEFNGRVVISSAAGTPEFTNDTIPVHINVVDPVTSYDIDFEYNSLVPYTNWDFSNIVCATGTITAHGGTYYGNTNAKTTASITTKAKVALPGTLTFYVSKESTNTTASYWKAQVSEDGSAWTDVESFEAHSMTKGDWNECEADLSAYSNVYVRISYGSSGAVRAIDDISLAMRAAAAVEAPTISGTTPFYKTTTVTLSCITEGAEIHYTTDGSDPTGGDNTYSAPFTIDATKTVKAIAIKGVKVSGIASKTFEKMSVLSIADAFTTIDGGGDLTNKFVEGYIYRVESYNSTYHSLTYWLTADGHKGDSLEVYSGKGLSSADFSSLEDLSVGDKVVVCGTLKKYNDIYEFDKNNYLVERVAKGAVASVEVGGTLTKTSGYEAGDIISVAGLTATATYENGFSEDVTALATWTVDGYTEKTIYVAESDYAFAAAYGGKSDATVAKVYANTHAVTFSTPANGTLVIKYAGDAITSGDTFVKGTPLSVEVTPASGYQLATLTANGVDISSTKAFTMGTEDIAVVATFEEIPHVYSVVGVASVIPVGWDPEATATEMTLNEGVYSYKVENVVLAAGTNYEWKIVEDHAWTVSYPQEGNASFSVDKNGRYDVTFTLNKSTKAYAATPELLEEIAVNRTFAVLGDFNSWSATAEEGAPDVATLSFTVNIDATGDYEFKLKVNDAWLANGYTYHRNYTGAADITANGSNMTLQVDQVGEYTFTWTFATNAMEITFPAKKSDPALSWNGIDEYNRAWAYREGKPFDFPTLVKPDGVSVTYSSDDGGTIININETTGAITLLSEGVAHITATSAANDTYNAGTATYTLYVCGPTSIALGGEAEKLTYEYGDPFDRTGLTATLHFNNGGGTYDVTDVATWTYDKETITSGGSVHVTVSYVGQEDEKYVYNVKVATHAVTWTQPAVGGTFEVLDNTSNPFSSGTTFRKGIEITVVPSAASNYELATLTANGVDIKSTKKYTIGTEDVVIAATFVKVPVAAGLEWSTSNAYVRKGSALNEFPTLSNPNGIEGITYESTDESIATIHASTGAISLLANGETTLKAIFAGNDDYLAQTVECTLHVAAGIVTITPAAPVALELGNVPFGSTRADYGQSFHLNITNLISGQYNQVKIDFTGSAFWTAGNNYITDNDQDGVIDVDVTIVPSEYWWSLSEANALGEQNTTITLMCTGSAQFEDVVVGTATMNVVASIPTGIDNAEAQEKAQKMIKDGMLVIIKNGQEFNVFGEKIK